MAYSIDRMPERISIGRETETGVTDVMIDCGAWVMKWPGMALHAIYTPEVGAPYILQTETDGGVLVWHVTDTDTATPGTGRMEIVGEMDGRRKVSATVKVSVAARMSGTVGEPPEAAKPWADRVVEAAERITGMRVQAETLAAGSGATAAWDGEQGLLTIGVPKGEQGPKGDQGPKGEKGEKGEPGKDAVVDATLTQSGQAADAKVTGDVVSQLKDDKADKATTYKKDEVDRIVGSLFRGGENYHAVMKAYFEANGCAIRTDLTSIVEGWYKLGRYGWTGGTKFLNPDQSSLSTGTKVGDNAGMTCTPSTNMVAGQDDYALLPLFAVVDCNWELGSGGKRIITAVDGINSAKPFVRNDPTRPVGVLQMAPWMKYEEDDTSYTYWMSDQEGKEGFYPIPEAIDLDGTVHSWVVHAKYGLGDDLSSISGVPIRVWDISHNSQRTMIPQKFNANSYYCGKCSCDDAWMKLHVYIKYASLTLDNIMNGCCSYYNGNCHPAVGETGVKRVIVTTAQGNALLVGSTMCVGSATYGGKATQCSVVDRAKITSIEDVEIGGMAYKAVYLDVDSTFDTTTALFWSTMQWYTGSTDKVLGNDGSPYSNTSSKEPYKLQGIEQSYGCYEIIADTILTYAAEYGQNVLTFNVCRNATKLATSVTAAYKKAGYSIPCHASSGWNYIKKLGHDEALPELMFGCLGGGSSSTYTKDGCYQLNQSSGNYEWLALGYLSGGLTYTGLSCAYANRGLSVAGWNIGGRLSANGSRGEYAA